MLTDSRCRTAKPAERAYKLADQKGLYLYVTPSGYKSWRWKFRIDGKEKRLIFGPYPEVTLAEARELRDQAAREKRRGVDPAVARKQLRALGAPAERTFEAIARKWYERRRPMWSRRHADTVLTSLEADVFPRFGSVPVRDVTAPMVLAMIRPIEERGAVDQAHRIRQRTSDVFSFAIAEGLAESDPAASIRKAMHHVVKRNYPALVKLEECRALLRTAEAAPAHPSTKLASRVLALSAQRSEPLRFMAPGELEDLDGAEPIWRIPAAKMKLLIRQREDEAFDFVVPLARQAVEAIKAALTLSIGGPFVFPTMRHAHRPMSENAISTMYRRFPEFRGRHVPHGWRSSFSTIMNERAVELGRPGDRAVIDLMLAHKPEGVEAAYNRAAYMPRRRQLAQEWADLLSEGLVPARSLLEGPRH